MAATSSRRYGKKAFPLKGATAGKVTFWPKWQLPLLGGIKKRHFPSKARPRVKWRFGQNGSYLFWEVSKKKHFATKARPRGKRRFGQNCSYRLYEVSKKRHFATGARPGGKRRFGQNDSNLYYEVPGKGISPQRCARGERDALAQMIRTRHRRNPKRAFRHKDASAGEEACPPKRHLPAVGGIENKTIKNATSR